MAQALSYHHYIGAVKEIAASELTDSDVVIFKGVPKSIFMKHEARGRIKVRFDLPKQGKDVWDLSLTNESKVYILGSRRITGMKDTEGL